MHLSARCVRFPIKEPADVSSFGSPVRKKRTHDTLEAARGSGRGYPPPGGNVKSSRRHLSATERERSGSVYLDRISCFIVKSCWFLPELRAACLDRFS